LVRASIRYSFLCSISFFFFFQAEDGIRDRNVTGVQTCALPIFCLCSHPLSIVIAVYFVPNNRSPASPSPGIMYPFSSSLSSSARSEERRVGKECRCRWGRDH